MKKIRYIYLLYIALIGGALASCADDNLVEGMMTPEQMELIGSEVQFEPFVQEFITTRSAASNYKEGQFNTNDLMYIYRQYWNETEKKWEYKNPPGTLYKYTDLTIGATGLFDRTSWKVYEGKIFHFEDNEYTNPDATTIPAGGNDNTYEKKLTKADSITWESGTTVRFRAWALSRLGNNLADPVVKENDKNVQKPGITTVNYPDYMVCDWVTVAGPTKQIPMAMRHLGCRLGFVPREDNQFTRIEIATDAADYMREDNADTNEHDDTDKVSEEEATTRAANVKAVYDMMCWPAGVDMEDMSLKACSLDGKTEYQHNSAGLTTEFIKTNIKKAHFNSTADSHFYLITIPYDISCDGEHKGEPLVLPPYTRFKIWLRDINNGDKNNTSVEENNYHIFSLSDITKKENGVDVPVYPDGITLQPGYSYRFTVGYNYRTLTVTAADNFSWAEQDLADAQAVDNVEPMPQADSYAWWKDAINAACEATKDGKLYEPTFEIKDANELQELINLVNGNFKMRPEAGEPELKKAVSIYTDKDNKEYKRVVKWYTAVSEPDALGRRDTTWATEEEKKGYIFYQKYTPAIGTTASAIEEDILKVPYSFYDQYVDRRFTVKLANDIDLKDWKLEAIGKQKANSTENFDGFAGNFDGQGYHLRNVYIDGGQLFANAQDGTICNLFLESTHPLSITGNCKNERILGCSVLAPSTTGTLAEKAEGTCYFVGCIHVDKSKQEGGVTKALVTEGEDVFMYGCMQAAYGINGVALASLKTVQQSQLPENYEPKIFAYREDMAVDSVSWTQVSCNYYDTELSPNAIAYKNELGESMPGTVGGKKVVFHRLQYIRGAKTHVLCAKNDFLVDNKTEWMKLSDLRKMEYYGVAPWRAMNFGIYMYNTTVADEINKCKMHYENNSTGYAHKYPELKTGVPQKPTSKDDTTTPDQYENVLEQYN